MYDGPSPVSGNRGAEARAEKESIENDLKTTVAQVFY